METNKILTANVLDIIFDGKNKEYGAYQLRRSYKKRLTKSLMITGSTLLLFLGGTVLANMINGGNKKKPDMVDTIMVNVHQDEMVAPPPPPPPVPKQPQPDLKQVIFTPPIIVKDNDGKPDEIIKEIEPDAAISNKNVESDNTNQIVQAPVDEADTKVVEVKKADDENAIVTFVQIEAEFPGGQDAWLNYLRNNLKADLLMDNGASAGKYTVIVRFVGSLDGRVSDVKCENDPGFGMCEEAVRVIKKTKNWTPAVQNGKHVNAYRRQPVVFLIQD